MQIPKPTPADIDRFRSAVPDDPRVEVKPMFGNLGAFVHGNMFMGLFGADIGVKLGPADADALRSIEGAGPFGPTERPMAGYVTLPRTIIGTPTGERWVASSLGYVATLPPKAAKATKAAKRSSGSRPPEAP
jgi:TfoX/Sxy family transcriptional regulator of competence genes